jgi:5-hydroxyisourate hydrolase
VARLSTHVLDTSLGLPAAGVLVELRLLENGVLRLLATAVTNADGRTDAPLISGDRLDIGVYELTFRVGDYLRRTRTSLPAPSFLGDIVVRVGIAESAGNYHIPLLLSPYGYSVYRGS